MDGTGAEPGRVIVIGSANADLVLDVDHRPVPGETVLASASTTTPGGKGANQAVAAARMGGRVSFVGCLGPDGHADLLRASLERAGVDLTHLAVVDAVTGYAVIVVTPDGENSIVVAAGANARLDPGTVDRSAGDWADRDVVVAQLEIPMDVVVHAARASVWRRARFVLNAAPAAVVPPEVIAVCDPLVVNQEEAAALLGHGRSIGDSDPSDGPATAAALLALGARAAVVTLGPQGVALASPEGAERIPAPQVRAVDTTGAGDGFVGALAAALSRGQSLAAAAGDAVAFAAAAVTRRGAQAAYVDRADVPATLSAGGAS
ncbi:ribokinase [Geodermatophilus sp. YIM 151500]|uniref:ribokinase n=1 Tax=Geodermatophilus sp. YIM 151500 TaxID=2984531 RepID=UPI0021E47F00|nr:ribokinase [Geodermatophilus sp. YIM 151500]MCV2490849.1 ribokinase [Geodermatophilus sp. YIM 151500]